MRKLLTSLAEVQRKSQKQKQKKTYFWLEVMKAIIVHSFFKAIEIGHVITSQIALFPHSFIKMK